MQCWVYTRKTCWSIPYCIINILDDDSSNATLEVEDNHLKNLETNLWYLSLTQGIRDQKDVKKIKRDDDKKNKRK